MRKFDCMYEITHEWSQLKYRLCFKNGFLRRVDAYNKDLKVFTSIYCREPCITDLEITTDILEEIVGYLCRGKEERNIKEFLEMFVDDHEYYNIIKRLLKEERRKMNDSIKRINEALGEGLLRVNNMNKYNDEL